MEAPLRIWVSPDDMGPREPVDWSRPFAELGPIGCEGETEYIRADLVPQWQPIETAPKGDGWKHGPSILVGGGFFWHTNDFGGTKYHLGDAAIGYWNRDWKTWVIGNSGGHDEYIFAEPNKWMPLPDPSRD